MGAYHVLAITQDGQTYAWGKADHGQLGIGKKDTYVTKPVIIKNLQDKKII